MRASANQTFDEYGHFVRIAKFMKRFDIHYSESEHIYSAKDKKTGNEYISIFGVGIKVTYARSVAGRGRDQFIRTKDTKVTNATEFAFQIYKCCQEVDAAMETNR